MEFNLEQLDETLEALLLVAGKPLSVSEITEKLDLQKSEFNAAVKRLKAKYSGSCGIHLLEFNGKVQLASNPIYADAVAGMLNPIREKELSRASMEVAAIIAYKQPITKTEVENVRGVNSDYAIQKLAENNIIEVVGRKDAVGKPLLFGTTDEFLKRFGLERLSDLPDYDDLLERIQVIRTGEPASDSLFNFQKEGEEYIEENQSPVPLEEAAAALVNEGGETAEAMAVKPEATAAEAGEEAEPETGSITVALKEAAPQDKPKRRRVNKDEFPDEEIPDFLKGEKLERIE